MRVALSPTRAWTPDRLARLFGHLRPSLTPPVEFHWEHDPRLSRDFYAHAVSMSCDPATGMPLDIRHLVCLPLGEDSAHQRVTEFLRDFEWGAAGAPAPARAFALHVRAGELLEESGAFSGVDAVSRVTVHVTSEDLECLDALYDRLSDPRVRAWQIDVSALSDSGIEAALSALCRRRLDAPFASNLEPVDHHLEIVRRHHALNVPAQFHDRRTGDLEYVVDAEGQVNGVGRLFEKPLPAIVASREYQERLVAGERRIRRLCGGCPFFGSCSGRWVAAGIGDEAGANPCVLRPVLERISRWTGTRVAPSTAYRDAASFRPGVRIRSFIDDEQIADRIALSAGTVAPTGTERYHVGALVPRAPWRSASPDEVAQLTLAPDAEWRHGSDIALFEPGEALLGPLLVARRSGAPADVSAPAWQHALEEMKPALAPYQVNERVDVSVLYQSGAGVPTVTRVRRGEAREDVLVGLHIDSWEGTSLRRRQQIRNRLCINLSRGVRYLLFVNLPLSRMMAELGLDDDDDVDPVTLFSGHGFLRRFSHYPVVRLELRPLEAYIAPTGNIVHDGAAPKRTESDLALHLLGYFAPPPRLAPGASRAGWVGHSRPLP